MKYKFLGKPDKKFPKLVTGEIYNLEVTTLTSVMATSYPLVIKPFYCPYSNWETFYKNWKPITLEDKS